MKHSITRYLGAALLLTSTAVAQGTYEEHVVRVREAYGVAAWPAAIPRDGLPVAGLELPGLRGGVVQSEGAFVTRDFYDADSPAGARPLLHLEARVCDDVEAARDVLVSWLAHLSSPELAPEDGAFGVELGQAGYVGPSGAADKAVSWVAFVRGNVAVRLLNVDLFRTPQLDVVGAARAIDAVIAARPALAKGALPPNPEIARLAPASTSVVAGAAPRLDVVVADPRGGVATLQWRVGGSGQGYVERRKDGWHLFTTGPGEVDVTLIAISSIGTVAERMVRVDVAPE